MPALIDKSSEVMTGLQGVGQCKSISISAGHRRDLLRHSDFQDYLEVSRSPPGFGLRYTVHAAVHLDLESENSPLYSAWSAKSPASIHRNNGHVSIHSRPADVEYYSFDFDNQTGTKFDGVKCVSRSTKSSLHSALSSTLTDVGAFPNLKRKKKVSFADDCGLILVTVNLIYYDSNEDHLDTVSFFENFYKPATCTVGAGRRKQKQCTVNYHFLMPIWDQPMFNENVHRQHVSLESVYLMDNENSISGTVKVKNIAFEKKLTVRCTFDGWTSFKEFSCIFQPCARGIFDNKLFDTFSFKIDLPLSSTTTTAQFAVQYLVDGREFWDNNMGKNYEFQFSKLQGK